jgi:ribosomal protein L15
MKLGQLSPNPGSTHPGKRKGMGIGSGNGKTAGAGHKGQQARNTVRPGFEGGQTPLHRRLPRRRGFTNRFAKEFAVINLSQLSAFEAGTLVTPELLLETLKGVGGESSAAVTRYLFPDHPEQPGERDLKQPRLQVPQRAVDRRYRHPA